MRRTFLTAAVAAMLLATPVAAFAQQAPAAPATNANFCTGPEGGNYQWSAAKIAENAKGTNLHIKIWSTKGSMENLERVVAGQCDVAIVQNDAFRVFMAEKQMASLAIEKVAVMYKEFVHLICNREAKIGRVTELRAADKDGIGGTPVAIGSLGSGSYVTWRSFVSADDKKYGSIPTKPWAGDFAVEKVKSGDAACMIFTAGLSSSFVTGIDKFGDKLHLVKANDSDFDNAKDEKRKPIYAFVDIPSGKYKHLQDGWMGSSVATVAVDALLITRTDWMDQNSGLFSTLLKAKQNSEAEIHQRVGQ